MSILSSRSLDSSDSQSIFESGDANGKLPPRTLALISITAAASSLCLPTLIAQRGDSALLVSWLTCMLSAIVMFLTSKNFSQAIFRVILLGLTISFFAYPMIPAIIFGGIISVGVFSALICSAKKSQTLIAVLLPVISYALSFALTVDPIISLLSLVFYLPAIPIGLTSRYRSEMTTSTVSGAAVLLLMVAGGFALALQNYYGEVSVAAIDTLVDEFTSQTLAYTKESFELVGAMEYTAAIEKSLILAIDTYVNSAVGLIIAICTIISYIAIKVKNALFSAYRVDEHLSPKSTTVTVSVTAAALFAVAFVMSFALDASNRPSLVAVICTNICIILTPGLTIMAVKGIKAVPKKFGVKGALLSISLITVTVLLFVIQPMILPLVGAIYIILGATDLWAKDFYGKGENQ